MLLALALAAAVPLSPLPFEPGLAAALGPVDPAPGAWAEYRVRSRGGADARLRATALPAAAEGRFWLVLAVAGRSGVVAAARLLVRGGRVERLHVMLAGQQPIELPVGALTLPQRPGGGSAPSRRGRTERVRVPAGTFRAEVLGLSGTRLWKSDAVPLWGLVRAWSRTSSMELLRAGRTGGHSVFPPGWQEEAGGATESGGGHGTGSESTK